MDLYDFVSAQPLILVEPDIPLLIDGLDIQNMCLSTIRPETKGELILFESCSGHDFAVTKIEFLDHATKPWYVRISFTHKRKGGQFTATFNGGWLCKSTWEIDVVTPAGGKIEGLRFSPGPAKPEPW